MATCFNLIANSSASFLFTIANHVAKSNGKFNVFVVFFFLNFRSVLCADQRNINDGKNYVTDSYRCYYYIVILNM